jgi:outer membrane protein TolC
LVPDLANPIHNIVTITNVDRPWETFSYDQVTYPMLPARESFENSGGSVQISMSQPLLKNGWIDGPRMAITLRKKDLKQSEWALQGQIMRTITEVQVAYYNLIASRELVKVREKALQEAEQQLRENKKRVEVGVMAPLDEKQAESQVAESRASLIRAQGDLAVNQNRLKNLLTDKYSEWRDVVLEPTETLLATVQVFNRQDSWHKGLSLRPDLVTAKIDLEKQNITLRYRRNQLFPELDLVGSYGQLGAGAEFSDSLGGIARGDSPSYSYGAVLRIPLSNRAERYRYKSAKALKEQAVLRLKQLEQTVMQQIDDAIIQAQSSLQQVEASKQASSFAEAAYQAEQKKMESGKSTSFQVLILQRILTERRAAEISSLTAYNIALAYLAQAEGSTLERMGIQVTTK